MIITVLVQWRKIFSHLDTLNPDSLKNHQTYYTFCRLEKLSTNSDEADVMSLQTDALSPIAVLSPRPHESQAVWTWCRGTNHKVLAPHVGLSSSQINHRMYVGAETSQSQRHRAWQDTEDVGGFFLYWSHIFSITNPAFGTRPSDRRCTGYKVLMDGWGGSTLQRCNSCKKWQVKKCFF